MPTRESLSEQALSSLKDFQRRTVTHAFNRLYLTKHGSGRFLVADEVGLGKTLVARGIIAKAIAHMEGDPNIDRIDIVYVCSNAAIARQNINRLNITGNKDYALATRLTLLPIEMPNLADRRLNFVSFTPGTTFDLKHSTGMWKERLLLYLMLRSLRGVNRRGLKNLMRCDVGKESWRKKLNDPPDYDRTLARRFLKALREDKELVKELRALSRRFNRSRASWPMYLRKRRNGLIASLRQELARSCVEALEPDLVILDEFQRFKDLLSGDTGAGELAQELMNYPGVRVLLLSATPYKMLTLYEDEENHYEDFIQTLGFLLRGDKRKIKQLREDLAAYRQALYKGAKESLAARDRLQRRLKKVMLRTERVPVTEMRDAMVDEPEIATSLIAKDLHRASALDQLARAVSAGDALEYWKSAPYLLNFMKGYKFKERFIEMLGNSGDVESGITEMLPHLLAKETLQSYSSIDPGNARLRTLVEKTLSREEWKALWLSPSLGYVEAPVHQDAGLVTKSLVFSTWSVVPDVIAAVCSYTAERERVRIGGEVDYFDLYDARKALLVFRTSEGRPETMSSLLMLYPSPTLSSLVDPLKLAAQRKGPLNVAEQREIAVAKSEKLARRLSGLKSDSTGREDQSWYWAAIGHFDAKAHHSVKAWVGRSDGWRSLMETRSGPAEGSAFSAHVQFFSEGIRKQSDMGAVPEDFTELLAELALGSPAVCASRSLLRVAPGLKPSSPTLLSAAATVAEGFRSLFNSPDVRSMLEEEGVPYWRQVLRYCIESDLQAVLDEYVHILRESLGLFSAPDQQVVKEIAGAIRDVLSIRTSSLDIDEIRMNGGIPEAEKMKIRCRYALRFADLKDDSDEVLQRAGVVREAFNSPFRPFILATTSIGQEGLDFHSYCHRVWHWNLPRNPVDMEQREGRINRFKGHAIRKNVAKAVGLAGLSERWSGRGDPWESLFNEARRRLRVSDVGASELKPYWIYEEVDDPARVERLIPLPPFSSETARLKALKRSLAVYRLAFGQPRQQDLIELLLNTDIDPSDIQGLQLDLSP